MKYEIGDNVQMRSSRTEVSIGQIMEQGMSGRKIYRVKYGMGFGCWAWVHEKNLKMSWHPDFLEKIKERME